MARSVYVLLLVAIMLAVTAGAAFCQYNRELVLFSGELDKATAGSWGAGTLELTDEQVYLDREVLEVETNGFHEGGRLELKSPEALSSFLANPDHAFLVLVVKVHQEEQKAQQGGAEALPTPGDMPMDPGMMDPGMMAPGGGPGVPPGQPPMPGAAGGPPPDPGMMDPAGVPMDPGMMPGGPMDPGMDPGMMGPGGGQQAAAAPAIVTKIRALMVTDKGQIDSGAIDIYNAEDALENWSTLVVPLSAFAGPGMDPEAKLENLALCGNADEKFWVATVKLVSESEPLVADAGEQRIVKAGKDVEFTAKTNTSSVRAQYIWDFDDWDGLQEDAFGDKATWSFDEPGFYVVTLAVKDRTGRRLTQTDRVHVKVEE